LPLQQVVLPLQRHPTVYAHPAADLLEAASQVADVAALVAVAAASVHRVVALAVLEA